MSRIAFSHSNLPVSIHPNIGLDANARQSVIKILNLILADEIVLSRKTNHGSGHGNEWWAHELQTFFDGQSRQMSAITAEVAERIQILGGSEFSSEKELLGSARLDGEPNVVPALIDLLADHEALTRYLREDAQKCSEIYEDQGSFLLLVGVMRIHEKMSWMLRSQIVGNQNQGTT
jgi:starvation-inducible DNA-binding protein